MYHILDSEIVKAMISKQSYGFNTFAANRIGEIQNSTNPSEWYWIKGSLNIADWLTRGKSPQDLDVESEWQSGAEFLKLAVEEWPIHSKSTIQHLPEQIKTAFLAALDARIVDTLRSN